MSQRMHKRAVPSHDYHKALSHELRLEVWTYLIEHSSGSASEIARALGKRLDAVVNHAKKLVQYGVAEIADERIGPKGHPELVYRVTARPIIDELEVEKLLPPARQGWASQVIRRVFADLRRGAERHAFARRADWFLARTTMNVDLEGWRELTEIHERALRETLEVEAKSAGRVGKSGEKTMRVSTSLLAFVMDR